MSSETTGSIDCPECSLSFDSRAELARHSKTHQTVTNDEKNFKPQEDKREGSGQPTMPTVEERLISRTDEKGKGRTPERNFKQPAHACRDCGQTFVSLNDLTNHYKQTHPESL